MGKTKSGLLPRKKQRTRRKVKEDRKQKIVFDTADVCEFMHDLLKGYGGKSFEELSESGDIEHYFTDSPVHGADVIVFKKPISIDRFLLMFGDIGVKGAENLEHMVKQDAADGFYCADPEKYVF